MTVSDGVSPSHTAHRGGGSRLAPPPSKSATDKCNDSVATGWYVRTPESSSMMSSPTEARVVHLQGIENAETAHRLWTFTLHTKHTQQHTT